jgi:hypothetical protein
VEELVTTRIFTVLVLVVLAVGLAGGAWAQYESSDRSPIGVRMNLFKTFSGPIGDIKQYAMAPGLDYNGKFDSLDRPRFIASVTWLAESVDTRSFKIVPITFQYLHYLNDKYPATYVGVGVGSYYVNYREFQPTFGWKSDNKRLYGMSVSYGIDWGGWYVEGTYQKTQDMQLAYGSSLNMDGISVTIGTRRAL